MQALTDYFSSLANEGSSGIQNLLAGDSTKKIMFLRYATLKKAAVMINQLVSMSFYT